jgi:hypothetical protein
MWKPVLKGESVTIDIKYDQAITVSPTVTPTLPSTAVSGTFGAVTKVSSTAFTIVFTADAAADYTGGIPIAVSGAKNADGLAQLSQSYTLAMDNLGPQLISFSTGTRVGKGGSATFTAVFNEKLGTAPKITTTAGGVDPKVDLVTGVSMILSADGLTATYGYEYKDTGNDAVHGALNVSMSTAGKDVAGNLTGGFGGSLTIDLGAPPAPALTLNGTQHDWGTQIKWSAAQGTDGLTNPGGAIGGTVYFVAVNTGSAAPTAFGFASDGSPSWTMATGVSNKQTGSLTTSGTTGASGTIYSAFTANGTFDIYAVFVGSTGNTSAITAGPQLTAVAMN